MDSNLLEIIGIDPAYLFIAFIVIIIVLLVLNLVTMNKLKKLTRKYDSFMRGKDAETLEDTLIKAYEEIKELKKSDAEKSRLIENILENLNGTYQKIGIIKYNAFREMGGNLSFSLALLNKENDGFIINAMHSREGCYTYIKEVIKGESFVVLGEEEKEALKKAININNYME